jgi:hypothetical protein
MTCWPGQPDLGGHCQECEHDVQVEASPFLLMAQQRIQDRSMCPAMPNSQNLAPLQDRIEAGTVTRVFDQLIPLNETPVAFQLILRCLPSGAQRTMKIAGPTALVHYF